MLLLPVNIKYWAFTKNDGSTDSGLTNYLAHVYLVSLAPLGIAAVIIAVGVARHSKARTEEDREGVIAKHCWMLLYLSYLVLPPCAMTQFRALNCKTLRNLSQHDKISFLRADSSVNCLTPSYKSFLVANGLLIAIYQSIPICWLIALARHSEALNPKLSGNLNYNEGLSSLMESRKGAKELRNISFLWSDYFPGTWWYEVVDM